MPTADGISAGKVKSTVGFNPDVPLDTSRIKEKGRPSRKQGSLGPQARSLAEVPGFTEEQVRNAAIIAEVGRSLGASDRDIQIAISAAIVESGLRNLDYGDRDSIGMFQQRDAWGSREARLDPRQSAKMFFLGGAAGQRGLLDFENRGSMGMGEAAQAVQVSAFPDRYAQHTSEAASLLQGVGNYKVSKKGPQGDVDTLAQVADVDALYEAPMAPTALVSGPSVLEVNSLGDITADEAGIGALSFENAGDNALDAVSFERPMPLMQPTQDPMAGTKMPTLEDFSVAPGPGSETVATTNTLTNDDALEGWRNKVVSQVRAMLGTPYVWGGTSYSGVDCSGLIALIYNKMGFSLPRLSADQARSGTRVGFDALKPGDLVAIDNSSRNNGADHIGVFVGNGQVIHAPRPGSVVEVTSLEGTFGGGWGISLNRSK